MTKHTIFFLHGMGNFKKDWLKTLKIPDLLGEKWHNYSKLKDLGTFDDNFKCIGIYYNDFFERLIAMWENMIKDLEKGITAAGIPASRFHLDDFMDIVSATNKDKFYTTHLLDVALYVFIDQIRGKVTEHVKEQIIKEILPENSVDRPRFSIVAHSLGTMVIHDALNSLYTGDGALNPSIARPRTLVQISNVSRLLYTDADPYTSAVRPGRNAWEGVCDSFINVSHKFDPFLIPRPFEVEGFKELDPFAMQYLVKEVEIHRITQLNVHDLTHYLANPNVHEALFEGLGYHGDISKAEHDASMEAFKKTTLEQGAETVIDALEEVDIKSVDSWKALFTALKNFLEKVKI